MKRLFCLQHEFPAGDIVIDKMSLRLYQGDVSFNYFVHFKYSVIELARAFFLTKIANLLCLSTFVLGINLRAISHLFNAITHINDQLPNMEKEGA